LTEIDSTEKKEMAAQQQQLPVCYHCKETITVPYLIAFNLAWHKNHLACRQCHKDFSDGSMPCEGPDGFAYCAPCGRTAFAEICGGCGEKILGGDMLKAAGKSWHSEHFACFTCKEPFGGTYFPDDEGRLYCEKHYYEAKGLLCADCEKPVLGGQMVSMQTKVFHLDHFRCNYCKKPLADAQYWERDESPYCEPCHLKLFG
jgi:paxillin